MSQTEQLASIKCTFKRGLVVIQVVEKGDVSGEIKDGLSDLVIPAVPGEYYSYSAEFTEERPLYALMKCKANKNRPIATAHELGKEANLLFLFGNPGRVCSVQTAHAAGLLGESIDEGSFGETWIAPARISASEFYKLRVRKGLAELAQLCQNVCVADEAFIDLRLGMVIAMMTDGSKYGLFCVKHATATSIQIDACHILV